MKLSNENITGTDAVKHAAETLVDSAVYYSCEEIPSDDRLREIRALVAREVNELIVAIKRQVAESQTSEPRSMTPSQLAKQWGINVDKVLSWIHSGKLEAVNLATNQTGRPRYRIDADAIAKFKAMRRTQAAPTIPRQTRRRHDEVKQYF